VKLQKGDKLSLQSGTGGMFKVSSKFSYFGINLLRRNDVSQVNVWLVFCQRASLQLLCLHLLCLQLFICLQQYHMDTSPYSSTQWSRICTPPFVNTPNITIFKEGFTHPFGRMATLFCTKMYIYKKNNLSFR